MVGRRAPTLKNPYVAAGIGSWGYKETSGFAENGENVDVHHVGYLANGGVEVRVRRWVGLAIDAEFTHVPGILGSGGVSALQSVDERDLGGVAGRFRVIVGR